jgi:hypothetical protein
MSKIFDEGAKHFTDNLDSKGNEYKDAYIDNPYINGPSTPDKALEWWQGMNHARIEHRKGLLKPPPVKENPKTIKSGKKAT